MAAILKLWRQIENPPQSIDAYLREEHSYQISSGSDLKRRSLMQAFLKSSPQQEEEQEEQDE